MADLFTVTAPLRILVDMKTNQVIAECYPHPNGLVYSDLYWNETIVNNLESCIHLIESEIKGDGPWRVADNVIHVLGCHGADAELASDYASWIDYCQITNTDASRLMLNNKLIELGVESKYLRDSKVVDLF